jgi:hypothetical protein
MSAPYHNIEERVEDTIKAYLSGALTGATDALPIKVAFDFDETEGPYISVAVPKVDEYPADSGGYAVDVIVAIVTSKTITRSAHAEHVAKVCDLIFEQNLITYLNTAGATYGVVFQLRTLAARERSVPGSERVTAQKFTLLARVT